MGMSCIVMSVMGHRRAIQLHLHCAEEELRVQPEKTELPKTPMTPKTPHPTRPSHLRSETASSSTSTPSSPNIKSALDASAPAFVPGRKLVNATTSRRTQTPSETTDGTSTPGSIEDISDSSPELIRWSPVDDPNDEFVRLKLKIMELTTDRRADEKANAAFLLDLQHRLKDVQDDYFFDEKEAQALFMEERSKVEAAALQAKLRGLGNSAPPKPPRTPAKVKEPPSRAESAVTTSDVFDGDDEPAGGMFELLEAMPVTETAANGVTIHVRDMGLPKHWSGRTPKLLLQETIRKTDKYAVVSFNYISGSSRVKRASVEVRWDGGKTQEWSMDDVACYDTTQAEQYIATVALHALTFPNPEGFAIGGTAAVGSQTSFRLLPPVFRDLWDELEQKRRLDDDVTNRAIWAKIHSILEPKLALLGKVDDLICAVSLNSHHP